MRFEEIDEDAFGFAPMQVLPEMYIELDMQLLMAVDNRARCSALIAGTNEVLDRFDHIATPKIICATGVLVTDQLALCVSGFRNGDAIAFADWLQGVVDGLAAHEELKDRCASDIRRARADAEAMKRILEAAHSLDTAAGVVGAQDFGAFPPLASVSPDYELMGHAMACLGFEIRRNPLRKQLDGVGGAAGSPEFNPYVASLYRLELATHRRLYRLFYRLAQHCGVDFSDDPHALFETPEAVDRGEL